MTSKSLNALKNNRVGLRFQTSQFDYLETDGHTDSGLAEYVSSKRARNVLGAPGQRRPPFSALRGRGRHREEDGTGGG